MLHCEHLNIFLKNKNIEGGPTQPQKQNCIAEMKNCDEWKPFLVMIAIDFSLTMVNILLKKVLQEGMNHLVFITYRLSVATIFLAPIGYFKERYIGTFNSFLYILCESRVFPTNYERL